MKQTGDYQPVTAVIAGTAKDDKFLIAYAAFTLQHIYRGNAGILHQDFFGNAQLLNGIAIHKTHFVNTGYLHHRLPAELNKLYK
jgi:hypothetical protein